MEAELYFSAYDALHQVTSSSSVSPVNLSGEEGSVNDAESLDSSMSTQSAQYEDIDDPLETDLTCTAGVMDDTFLDDSVYHEYHFSSRNAGVAYRKHVDIKVNFGIYYGNNAAECGRSDGIRRRVNVDEATGPIDPMVGTPMELMNISTLLSSENPRPSEDTISQTIRASRDGSECSTEGASKTSSSSFSKLSEDDNANDKSARDTEVVDSEKAANVLTTSCVDSGIGGTISTHSELSAFCLSPSADLPPNPPKSFLGPFMNYRQQQSNASTPGSFDDDVVSFLDLPIAPREDTVADEVFVSKFVLSEQVFRQEWYLERQPFLESAVLDTVPKIKAAMIAEEWEDVVVRANAELTRLMHLITVLDRYPLVSDSRPLLPFLHKKPLQLLNTLVAFVPEELRWCCLRMYRHKFSPYVRLQAVRRCELPYVMQCGALSSWPICVIDVDRATVCMSPPYSRHRVLKQRADAQRISIILDSSFRCKPVTL
ncbi:hypothetical protein TELCIR_02248 [Teladorsagia circumcincta]|uniref:Uncharacterized protein n=1 Tax=Teladorsagia circumcincta TaxID=45464 RepID=A0A2G9V1Q7_TELCI|nr:hypothetical protein TELCIR_02248 [Teladorsagia circumcincta]